MKKRILYITWGVMYALCAGLGFVAPKTDAQKVALMLLSLVFFVPPAWLTVDALRVKDRKTMKILGWISGLSLGLTTAAYIANLASVTASDGVGDVLYGLLIIISAPMVSMGAELMSLFLWACLLVVSLQNRK